LSDCFEILIFNSRLKKSWRYQRSNQNPWTEEEHNPQNKKDTMANNNLQNICIRLKIEEHEPNQNPGVNSGAPEG